METGNATIGEEYLALHKEFFEEMRRDAHNFESSEPVQRAFCEAFHYLYQNVPAYTDLVDEYIATEEVTIASYRTNKFFVAHQALLIPDRVRERTGYPNHFDEVSSWVKFLLPKVRDPEHPDYKKLIHNLDEPLQINRRNRRFAPAFITTMRQNPEHYLGGGPTVVEVGSAADLVLKAWAVGEFAAATVVDEEGLPDYERTKWFNGAIRMAPLGQGIGIEQRPPQNEEHHDRIKAGTLSPGKLDRWNNRIVSEEDRYDLAVAVRPPNVVTIPSNLFHMDPNVLASLEGRVDQVFMSHVTPQLIGRFDQALEIIRPWLNSTGALILNEYGMEDEEDPTRLIQLEGWYGEKWKCRTIVRLNHLWDEGWFTLLEWETAACERVRVVEENVGRLALPSPGSILARTT